MNRNNGGCRGAMPRAVFTQWCVGSVRPAVHHVCRSLLVMSALCATGVEARDWVPEPASDVPCEPSTHLTLQSESQVIRLSRDQITWTWNQEASAACLAIDIQSLALFSVGLSIDGDGSVSAYDGRRTMTRRLSGDASKELWTPLFSGSRLVIDLRLLGTASTGVALRFASLATAKARSGPLSVADLTPDSVTQVRRFPFEERVRAHQLPSSCHIDAPCGFAGLEGYSSSVVLLVFNLNGVLATCSGTLVHQVADNPFNYRPFILTANHCIATQGQASVVNMIWFDRSDFCNGPDPDLMTVPITYGTNLRVTSGPLDVTLLESIDLPPSGASYMDWTANPVPVGTTIAMIGHPGGARQAIAFGTLEGTEATSGRSLVTLAQGVSSPGNSGGSWLTPDGKVAGVTQQVAQSDITSCGGSDVSRRVVGTTVNRFYTLVSPWLDPEGVRNPSGSNGNDNDDGDGGGGSLGALEQLVLLVLLGFGRIGVRRRQL